MIRIAYDSGNSLMSVTVLDYISQLPVVCMVGVINFVGPIPLYGPLNFSAVCLIKVSHGIKLSSQNKA